MKKLKDEKLIETRELLKECTESTKYELNTWVIVAVVEIIACIVLFITKHYTEGFFMIMLVITSGVIIFKCYEILICQALIDESLNALDKMIDSSKKFKKELDKVIEEQKRLEDEVKKEK